MATAGQKVVLEALEDLGVIEVPWGSNRGVKVSSYQKPWGLNGVPWCACAVAAWYNRAGIELGSIASPSTGAMCSSASGQGHLVSSGIMPPGSILIKCGIHTEIVVRHRSDGLIDCIGGNVNQGVRRTVRALGGEWRGIIIPAIEVGEPEPIVVYGFDDPLRVPERKGPWRTRDARERVIAGMAPASRKMVRRIRVKGPNPYAFEIVRRDEWRFGPWRSKEARNEAMHDKQEKSGRSMRPWNQKVHNDTDLSGGGEGGTTSGETTT